MSDGSPTRVVLALPRQEVEAVLKDALQRGEEISAHAGSVRDEQSLSEWLEACTRWFKFVKTALQRVSEGDALESEFSARAPRLGVVGAGTPSIAERVERREASLRKQLNTLRSILERLDLFESTGVEPARNGAPDRPGDQVFVVHGRQEDRAEIVARFVEKVGLRAVILSEQPNRGRTLIEKFEANAADVGFAIVLFLADDWGRGPDDPDWPAQPNRARENVVLETGYFIGKLGRSRVAALMEPGVDRPSDIHGVVYIPFDDSWQMRLLREMKVIYTGLDANLAFE